MTVETLVPVNVNEAMVALIMASDGVGVWREYGVRRSVSYFVWQESDQSQRRTVHRSRFDP
jgi:hypothetical protein